MGTDETIREIRRMYVNYSSQKLGLNPALLPNHLAEFLGYANLLYSHYAEYMLKYRQAESTILAEEADARAAINAEATRPSDKMALGEMESRVTVRFSAIKGRRERLEAEVKSATIHINTIQSLMRRQSDEAKGMM